MKSRLLIVLALLSMLLGGCATPKIQSNVTVFQDWPADLRGQSFAFEPAQAQQNELAYRAYAALVRNELQRLGFVDAPSPQAAAIKVSLDYGISGRDVRVVEPVVTDPFWHSAPYYRSPFYRSPFYRPMWRGYHWPYYDPFWVGVPMTEYRERQYELFKRHIRIILLRASDGKRLYEVTVNSEGSNGSLAAVMPYMVRSAFIDFPASNGMSRRIELEMKQ